MTDQSQFVDVYSLTTGVKQRVPRIWLDDAVLGRDFAKTPSQRELDGELPARPAGDAKAKEIDAFAEAAGVDLAGVKSNADKLVAIENAMGNWAPVQEGVVAAEPPEPVDDPLDPAKVAHVPAEGLVIEGFAETPTVVEDGSDGGDGT